MIGMTTHGTGSKRPKPVFSTMHVDRMDVTGYTRTTLVDGYQSEEWIDLDEPLPLATTYRAAVSTPFRLFDRNA